MKKIFLLILSLLSCVVSSADQRGVSFEKDGLIYTIASEYVIKRTNMGRKAGDPEILILNEGDVYVSGCTATDCDIKIPTVVSFPTTYCKGKEDTARYNVLGIGEKAFENVRLNKLTIPYGLRFYGNQAFHNLEIKSGVLVVPPAMRMKANVFDGLKSKVLFTDLEFAQNKPIMFEKTFENPDLVPDIYIYHGIFSKQAEGINKKDLCTVGINIYNDWINTYSLSGEYKIKSLRSSRNNPNELFTFYTLTRANDKKTPKITIRLSRKFEKFRTDIDMISPYEYICWNPYTNKKEVCYDFAMNESIFRYRKEADYFYFTLDGKPLTDKLSLLDSDGRDPFGLQVMSEEEVKAKKEAKEREMNLNRKVNDLKKVLGF